MDVIFNSKTISDGHAAEVNHINIRLQILYGIKMMQALLLVG
jgi:hypothetical protein